MKLNSHTQSFQCVANTKSVRLKYSLYSHSSAQVFCNGTPCYSSTDRYSNVSPTVGTVGGNSSRVNNWLAQRESQWAGSVGFWGRCPCVSDKWLVGGQLPCSRRRVYGSLILLEYLNLRFVRVRQALQQYISHDSFRQRLPPSPLLFITNLRDRKQPEERNGEMLCISTLVLFFITFGFRDPHQLNAEQTNINVNMLNGVREWDYGVPCNACMCSGHSDVCCN